MNFLWLTEDRAIFTYGDEENPSFYHMKGEDWEDFGKPKHITVTIEPGDLLNGNRVND